MTGEVALAVLGGVVISGGLAHRIACRRVSRAPAALVRVNVSGESVPAVLGEPLVAGALLVIAITIGTVLGGWEVAGGLRIPLALGAVIAIMAAAGRWDDLRGDERPRGFSGHLGAMKGGRLTGGLVKILAGGIAGLIAGVALSTDPWTVAQVTLLVALSANLMNLFDRAPGRAAKVWLLIAAPLFLWGEARWKIAASGVLGSVLRLLPWDLGERAMLGDMGANPSGAALGVGLAVSLDEPGRLVAIGVLLLLNALSEKVSFSEVIGSNQILKKLDRIGRKS